MKKIAIVSIKHDLHAYGIKRKLMDKGVEAHIIHSDSISNRRLAWTQLDNSSEALLESIDGELVNVAELDVVWWRRIAGEQTSEFERNTPEAILVNRDSSAALLGCLYSSFRGVWVNDPIASEKADNKLVQLTVAKKSGLAIPKTLISNDPVRVTKFCKALDYNVIAKPIRGIKEVMLFAHTVLPEDLSDEETIKLCPTIYQEKISGTKHIRCNCFGDKVISILIETTDLDWRRDLDCPFTYYEMDKALEKMVLGTLQDLGLRMGIVDLKIDDNGQPYWFEVNSQGQFLFCEGLAGVDLQTAFSEFLLECAGEKEVAV